MPHTESLRGLAGLAALGALDGTERSAFDRHRREPCAACQTELAARQRELSILALSAPPLAPPAALRARLLAAAREMAVR